LRLSPEFFVLIDPSSLWIKKAHFPEHRSRVERRTHRAEIMLHTVNLYKK